LQHIDIMLHGITKEEEATDITQADTLQPIQVRDIMKGQNTITIQIHLGILQITKEDTQLVTEMDGMME